MHNQITCLQRSIPKNHIQRKIKSSSNISRLSLQFYPCINIEYIIINHKRKSCRNHVGDRSNESTLSIWRGLRSYVIYSTTAIVTRSTRSQEGQSFASCSWHALAFNICFAGWRIVRNRFFDRVIRGGSSARRIRAVGHSRNDQTDAIRVCRPRLLFLANYSGLSRINWPGPKTRRLSFNPRCNVFFKSKECQRNDRVWKISPSPPD